MTEQGLPPSWTLARLGDVGEWGSGGTPKRTNASFYGGGIPWLKIGDLTDGPVWEAETSITQLGLESSSAKMLGSGVILLAMYGSIGKLGITKIECATNQAIAFCRHIPEIVSREYLFYGLKYLRSTLISLGQGGTQQNISQTLLKRVQIPLAPLNEQCRIVDKIETLFAQLDKGEEALCEVQSLLARYRQSVLKAAVTGQLTADWRAENANHLEQGRDLLARILQTRRETWQGRGKYKEPAAPDTTDLPELPEGWVWASVGMVGEVITGATPPTAQKERFYGGRIPFLKPTDLDQGENIVMAREHLTKDGAEKSRVIGRDSVLVTSIGATTGKTGICRIDRAAFNQQINAIAPINDVALGDYLYWAIVEGSFQARIWENAAATTLPIINKSKFSKLPLPLPPLAEQKVVVERTAMRISEADNLQAVCEAELVRSTAMRQSILKEAFAGRLVPQDRADEPAADLLARIREARASTPRKTRRKAQA